MSGGPVFNRFPASADHSWRKQKGPLHCGSMEAGLRSGWAQAPTGWGRERHEGTPLVLPGLSLRTPMEAGQDCTVDAPVL